MPLIRGVSRDRQWSLAEKGSPSLGREDAELVAFGVGQHHPALVALPDIDVPRAQRDHPLHLGPLIFGPEVEVDAVLDDLVVWYRHEQPVRPGAGRRMQNHVAVVVDILRPAQHLRPPGSSAVASWASMQISSNFSPIAPTPS